MNEIYSVALFPLAIIYIVFIILVIRAVMTRKNK